MSPGGSSRALAARAVDRVASQGETLDEALARVLPEAGRDRARVQALAYGTLRSHHRLRFLAGRLRDRSFRPRDRILESLLAVGLFELLDESQPPYAVVSACVEACRLLERPGAAGLVNAVLRRFQRESAALLRAADEDDEARHSHPAWLLAALRQDWPGHWESVVAANQAPPPLWLRVNRLRTDPEGAARRITAETGVTVHRDPAFPDGLRLETPLPVEQIPGFAAGELTVQDAASQVAVELLDLRPGQRVLDACAAPGGKLTHLLERRALLAQAGGNPEPGAVTALDVDAGRLVRVRENLDRLGLTARVLAGDGADPPGWWDGEPFDRILLDAPCSGTGVIRRHPDIKLLRRAADLPALAHRQARLLRSLWSLLRPGGRLVYATCSVLAVENAGVVAPFLAEHPEALLVADAVADPRVPGFAAALAPVVDGVRPGPGWQFLPGAAATDGFYYAVMSRRPA